MSVAQLIILIMLCHLPSPRLTSLLVQHNQSPDAGIFALFPKRSQVERRDGGGREEK